MYMLGKTTSTVLHIVWNVYAIHSTSVRCLIAHTVHVILKSP